MVFGKKEFCTAVAVLAAVLMAAASLLVDPAWSQNAGGGQGSTQLKPIPEAQTTQAQQQQEQQTAQASESLAGQETETFDNRNGDGFVDLIVIPRECTVTEGASLVLEDDDGTQGTFIDNQNVQITQEANQLRVVSNPPGDRIAAFNIRGGDGTLDGGGLTVATSTGIQCEAVTPPPDDSGDSDGGGGDSGDGSDGGGTGDTGDTGDGTDADTDDSTDADTGDDMGDDTGDGTSNQQDGDCSNPEVVQTFTGNGNKQTPIFDINAKTFRITSEVTATGDPESIFFSIGVRTADGEFVASIDQEQPGTSESFVNEGPGSFFLDILAANIEYEITVEECADQQSDNEPTTDPDDQSPVDQRGDVVDEVTTDDLPDTGGAPLAASGATLALVFFGVTLLALRLMAARRESR